MEIYNKFKKFIDFATKEFKQKMMEFCQNSDFSKLKAKTAEHFIKGLKFALAAAGGTVFVYFISSYEYTSDTLEIDGEKYRFKQERKNEYLIAFGKS